MLQKVSDVVGTNADWVKKILKESIYVDLREAEKTLSHKSIILDGLDYTVRWRSPEDQGKRRRQSTDQIVFNAAPKTVRRRRNKKK
jgi:hypothetical protein